MLLKNKTILVTGADGFIGSDLMGALFQRLQMLIGLKYTISRPAPAFSCFSSEAFWSLRGAIAPWQSRF